jgi:hypothetical protein
MPENFKPESQHAHMIIWNTTVDGKGYGSVLESRFEESAQVAAEEIRQTIQGAVLSLS